ncbi:hypothetical protein Rhe02_81210 [Rhizocola hellebori]|uniref:Uncharacterized protein n=1 Tax=Rhizocola hellebori TaxID=1392758 RepID=A0A8J3QI04_9ACTN|nr:hypothetical protein [Rhizocola hellebori]GIH10054.1 hypothetical protein Rhe02_81210 [Rhizocola hellebori]
MIIAVASHKSGGATTTAAALALSWPGEPAVLVEADPAGGDMSGWHAVPDVPGLVTLASACRAGVGVELSAHSAHLPLGLEVVPAPAGRPQASASIGLLADADTGMWAKARPVVVDVGRLEPGSPALPLAAAADVLLVVCRVDVLSLLRASLAEQAFPSAALVLIGQSIHDTHELETQLTLTVAAQLPLDRHAAEVIAGTRRPPKGWTRVGLPAAARALARLIAPQPLMEGAPE